MAKIVYELNQSLDGYVDHQAFHPDPVLFRHFIEQERSLTGTVYGRRMYEIMRYWDDDSPAWGPDQRDFAAVWRQQPKWVVSSTLKQLGPNATLLQGDLKTAILTLKSQHPGEIAIAGPALAGSLTTLGLIEEYRLYIHPVVLGSGTPFFTGPRPRLRLISHDLIAQDILRLTYAPNPEN